jgi:macrolide-specific efflux system membrane fusion protein
MLGLKKYYLLLFVAAISGIAAWWYRAGAGQSNLPPQQNTVPAVRRDFTSTVLATGSVQAQVGAEVRVGARVSGKVNRLHANIGDVVRRGDLIAELEKEDLQAILDQRSAEMRMAQTKLSSFESLLPLEIEKAEAEMAQAEATLALARKEAIRYEDLLRQELATRQQSDHAREQLAVAQANLRLAEKALQLIRAQYQENLKQARAEVDRTRAAYDNSRVQLSYTTITAPIEGVISSVSTQEGETVAAGFNAPTFVNIIDLNRLQVDAYVDEVDIGKIEIGQKAVFTVDTYPGREFSGTVTAIYPKAIIEENVVNYDVVIGIEDSYQGLLRPEMTTNVTIFLESRKDVLAVPARAVKREQGRNFVYVVSGGAPQPRPVTVGWRDGEWIEIVRGLEEGEEVSLESAMSRDIRNRG